MLSGSSTSSGPDAPERQQVVDGHAELPLRVAAERGRDELAPEAIEARVDRRVGGEDVARTGRGERDVERNLRLRHEVAGALQRDERRVPLVEVTDLRQEADRPKQATAADPEGHLLEQPDSGPPP